MTKGGVPQQHSLRLDAAARVEEGRLQQGGKVTQQVAVERTLVATLQHAAHFLP